MILGSVCIALLPLVVFDMAVQLPYMPEEWWLPENNNSLPAGQFDLRTMIICPGPVGWLGGWGYLLSLIWVPLAGYKAWRATQLLVPLQPLDRVLLTAIPTVLVAIELIHHLTPLKYGYPLL